MGKWVYLCPKYTRNPYASIGISWFYLFNSNIFRFHSPLFGFFFFFWQKSVWDATIYGRRADVRLSVYLSLSVRMPSYGSTLTRNTIFLPLIFFFYFWWNFYICLIIFLRCCWAKWIRMCYWINSHSAGSTLTFTINHSMEIFTLIFFFLTGCSRRMFNFLIHQSKFFFLLILMCGSQVFIHSSKPRNMWRKIWVGGPDDGGRWVWGGCNVLWCWRWDIGIEWENVGMRDLDDKGWWNFSDLSGWSEASLRDREAILHWTTAPRRDFRCLTSQYFPFMLKIFGIQQIKEFFVEFLIVFLSEMPKFVSNLLREVEPQPSNRHSFPSKMRLLNAIVNSFYI